MKSKAHYKKCTELGLNPIPTSLPDDDGCEFDDSASMTSERTSQRDGRMSGTNKEGESRVGSNYNGDSDTDDGEETDDVDSDSDGEFLADFFSSQTLKSNFFIPFTDTDESRGRLPEHEAAHCLLSLSMTPTMPNVIQQPHSQNPTQQYLQQFDNSQPESVVWRPQSAPQVQTEPERRIIFSSTSTKTEEFDLLNHEQYYSDPNLNKFKRKSSVTHVPIAMKEPKTEEEEADDGDDEEDLIPMDLTKKSRLDNSERRAAGLLHVKNVIAPISDPALLNTLVSLTEKVPNSFLNSMHFTDNVQYSDNNMLPQEYITEVAVKESKMKQSQQLHKLNEYYMGSSSVLESPSTPVLQNFGKLPQQSEDPQKSTTKSQFIDNQSTSSMDILSDIASKSDKLEVKASSSAGSQQSLLKNANDSTEGYPKLSTDMAKSVASEYLKLTKQKKYRNGEETEIFSDPEASGSGESSSNQASQAEMVNSLVMAQTIVVGEDGFRKKPGTGSPMTGNDALLYTHLQDEGGRPICSVCKKVFHKISQLRIHMNIHYMERKYRCEPCAVSFRTQGHLLKHERSVSHQNKVSMTSTFGVPTVTNPRPFKCKDCKIAFRIHGHLAKHLRSKMHVLKLECLQKLPFGTYAEMERSGYNFAGIDTSDCDSSLSSLRELAKKLNEKDPSKIGPLPPLNSDDTDGDAELNDLVNGINDNYDSDSSDAGLLSSSVIGDLNLDKSTNFSQKIFDNGSSNEFNKLKLEQQQQQQLLHKFSGALGDNDKLTSTVKNGDNSSTNKKIKLTTSILSSTANSGIVNTSTISSNSNSFVNANDMNCVDPLANELKQSEG